MCVALCRGHDRGHAGNVGELRIAEPVPHLEANDGQVADRPRFPAVDEHASLTARAAGGDDVELVEEIRVADETLQVVSHTRPAKTPIGDDVVEVVHEVRLGHHRQGLDVLDRHAVEIDPRQPLSVPGGSGGRHAEEGPEGTALLGRELRGRPRDLVRRDPRGGCPPGRRGAPEAPRSRSPTQGNPASWTGGVCRMAVGRRPVGRPDCRDELRLGGHPELAVDPRQVGLDGLG